MVIDKLLEILEAYKVPVYKQGSMSDDDEYPETFITFWNSDTEDHSHYDNDNYGVTWTYQVYVYSSNPSDTYSILESIRKDLKESGWTVPGKGYDASSDEPTHTGRAIEAFYLEIKEDEPEPTPEPTPTPEPEPTPDPEPEPSEGE